MIPEPRGPVGVMFRLQGETSEWVALQGIEAGRYEHHVWNPVHCCRDDRGPEIPYVQRRGLAGATGHVEDVAHATLVGCACSGIPWVLVE